ncbi:MAG: 5'/3'-nucleotidase SurE [Hyphomicrobiaceae bacterium]
MRILITNDDGIDADGLASLKRIALTLSDDVWTVAPQVNHSGAGHSLSLREPLRMNQLDERTFSVRGTPTDCVIMACRHVLKDHRPDLILSGVNRGQNIAEDVTYSGTIAAAFEGTLIGIKSIALSQAFGGPHGRKMHYETAEHFGPDIVRKLIALDWPDTVLMNVNFPPVPVGEVRGVQVTRQGRRDLDLMEIDERHDTWGTPYYWLAFQRTRSTPPEGTDLWAVYNGYVSISPLKMNLTFDPLREQLGAMFAA